MIDIRIVAQPHYSLLAEAGLTRALLEGAEQNGALSRAAARVVELRRLRHLHVEADTDTDTTEPAALADGPACRAAQGGACGGGLAHATSLLGRRSNGGAVC